MNTKHFRAFKRTYHFEKSIQTTFTPGYLDDSGSRWGVYEMWRESMQNCVDEAEYMADHEGGEIWDYYRVFSVHNKNSRWGSSYHTMQDYGRGVDVEQIVLIGESGKRGSGYRGEKGEGESNSFLVAARENIMKTMLSQDWAIEAEYLPFNDNVNHLVLTYHIYRTSKPIEGTIWRFGDNPHVEMYMRDRNEYFAGISPSGNRKDEARRKREYEQWDKAERKQRAQARREIKLKSTTSTKPIQMPRKGTEPRLFVRGVYVRDLNSLFSYNITNVQINRDRSMVDEASLYAGIAEGFASDSFTKKMAETYWQNAQHNPDALVEYHRTIDPVGNYEVMRKAFAKVFGKKAVLATETFMQTEARALGFVPINLDHTIHQTALLCGVMTDEDTSGFLNGYKEVKPTARETALLIKLDQLRKAMGFKNVPVVIASKIANDYYDIVNGICVDDYGKVVLLRKLFAKGQEKKLVRVYIHEFVHVKTREGDGQRGFTSGFEEIIMDLLTNGKAGAMMLVQDIVKG